jgi:RNase H-fold protein (predicted Holliday junction resolvase)
LTSKLAETELEKRGKPYKKSDIDALAATYILDDYISAHQVKEVH